MFYFVTQQLHCLPSDWFCADGYCSALFVLLDHDWMRFVKRPIKSQAALSHSADWLGDPIVIQPHSTLAINYQQGCVTA
jgi:hypothetical protein